MVLCLAATAGGGVLDGGLADAGAVTAIGARVAIDAGYDAGIPATWRLEAKLTGALREGLIADFTSKEGGVGETALTREEAVALLDDPRASTIYGDKTISIVAPSMTTKADRLQAPLPRRPDARRRPVVHALRFAALLAVGALLLLDHLGRAR